MSGEAEAQVETVKVSLSDDFASRMGDEYARRMEELAPREWYDIEINGSKKRFKRRKILTKERTELEGIRTLLANQARRFHADTAKTEDSLYKKSAEFFLINAETNMPMSDKEYEQIPFEDIKAILDACTFRTEKPIPPLEKQKKSEGQPSENNSTT